MGVTFKNNLTSQLPAHQIQLGNFLLFLQQVAVICHSSGGWNGGESQSDRQFGASNGAQHLPATASGE